MSKLELGIGERGPEVVIPEDLFYFDEAGNLHVPLSGGVAQWLASELLKYVFASAPTHGHPNN